MNAAVLLLLVGLSDAARLPCPYPFEAVGDKCYYFSRANCNWISAQAMCQSRGGYLATPTLLKEQRQLYSYLESKVESPRVWIGGTDMAQEDNWGSFINGKNLDHRYFHPHEPNNAGGNEDCLELGWEGQALFNDNGCHIEQNFVCEKETCPSNELECPSRYTRVGDECFYLSTYTARWRWARSYCQFSRGGDLAVPSNLDSFKAFLAPHNVNPWIGGTDMENEGNWLYIDGSAINSNSWSPEEPNNWGGDEDCLQFSHDTNPPLNDNWCDRYIRYVCEAPPRCSSQRTVHNYSWNNTEPDYFNFFGNRTESNYSLISTEPISNPSWNYTEPNYFNFFWNKTDSNSTEPRSK